MKMRRSEFYILFACTWIVSLFSTILFLSSTHVCRVRQPINGETYMVDTGPQGVRMPYSGDLKKQEDAQYPGPRGVRIPYKEGDLGKQEDIQYHEPLGARELSKEGDLRKQEDVQYPGRVLSDIRQNNLPSNTQTTNTDDIESSKIDENKELRMCSTTPRQLEGRMNISQYVKVEDFRNQQVLANVKYGGVYRPTDCKSSESVAIIIPYRDRTEHLNILVNHLHMMLQRQKLHYGIYVVEMLLPIQFNRGLLANAGFMTALSIREYSCYIIHEVDLLPINDFNTYTCGSGPKHFVARSSKYKHGQLPYAEYIGGVLALTKEHILHINGFSNLYFGWGGEDDDMYKRITGNNLVLERVPEHIGIYMALPHDDETPFPSNSYRQTLVNQAEMRMKYEGLSSIVYHRKSLEFRPLYTWILIECDVNEVRKSSQHYNNGAVLVVNLNKDPNELKTRTVGKRTKTRKIGKLKTRSLGKLRPNAIEVVKSPNGGNIANVQG